LLFFALFGLGVFSNDVFSPWPFFTTDYVEGNDISLVKGFETILAGDIGIMDEDVLAITGRDKAIPFTGVKPFYCPFSHTQTPYIQKLKNNNSTDKDLSFLLSGHSYILTAFLSQLRHTDGGQVIYF
jgi:hypothetical protein